MSSDGQVQAVEVPDAGVARNVQGTWKIRRRIIFTTLILCAFSIFYIMIFGEDTQINEAIVLGCFSLIGATIGSYVFGAVWDDKTQRKHIIGGPNVGVMPIGGGNIVTNRDENPNPGGPDGDPDTVVQPSEERRKKAAERLARMRAKKNKVDNPDA